MLYPKENRYRSLRNLDGYWFFCADRENTGEEKGFKDKLCGDVRTLGVPASWNEQANDLYTFTGRGWYEKDVFVPDEWRGKAVYLRFGSVAGVATVFVNGKEAFAHTGTALPFEKDISEYLCFGETNRITVIADNTLDPLSLPPASDKAGEGHAGFTDSYPAVPYDFFPYGGIQRSVWLYSAAKNRIEDICVKTDVSGNGAKVCYEIKFTSRFSGEVTVETNGQKQILSANDTDNICGEFKIENPRLWDIGKPELYELTVETDFDEYSLSYGIRTIKVSGNEFLLNGKPVFFKGFGKHEDFFVLGKGFNAALWAKDFHLLKWIGANSFRTSHYPYDENIYDYADKNGILIIDETPFVSLGKRCYTKEILSKACLVLEELYNRDKNHPSVVMWSLANEPVENYLPEGDMFFKGLADKMRSLDNTRPITYAAFMEPPKQTACKYFDVVCMNEYMGWYVAPGRVADTDLDFKEKVENYYKAFKKPIIMTEFGADAVAGMHNDPPLMFTEEYQREMILRQYKKLRELPYVIGAHIWAFADFRTAQTTGRVVNNHKGVFTRDRQPKLAAHAIKEIWNSENR